MLAGCIHFAIKFGCIVRLPSASSSTSTTAGQGLAEDLTCSRWTITAAVLVGFIAYFVLMRIFNQGMWIIYRCQALTHHDCSFLYDVNTNNHTIIVAAEFEKFDYLSMKTHLLSKAALVKKCKSILVKKLGLFWMKELDDEEWRKQMGNVVRLQQNVTSPEELREFALKENESYDFYEAPQYRFYLIPDYAPDRSAILVKVHHSLSDGLGFVTFLQSLNDVYRHEDLPAMKPLSFLKEMLINLISPFLILRTFAINLTMSADTNFIKKDGEASGKKTLGVIPDLHLPELKKYTKENKCTINDYSVALLSVSLHEYFKLEEKRAVETGAKVYAMPKTLNMSLPFSLRQPFKSL